MERFAHVAGRTSGRLLFLPAPKLRTFFRKPLMPSFPSHVLRVVVGAEYLMAELALADTRMLLAASITFLHLDHYLIVQHRAIKNASNVSDSNNTSSPARGSRDTLRYALGARKASHIGYVKAIEKEHPSSG